MFNICVKIDEIPGRRYIKPALIGFRIKESGELDDLGDGVASADKKDQDAAKSLMSEMERILNKMIKCFICSISIYTFCNIYKKYDFFLTLKVKI